MTARPRLRTLVVGLATGILIPVTGCGQMCACPPLPTASGLVLGTLTTASGGPVAGFRLRIASDQRSASCPPIGHLYGESVPESLGRYRMGVHAESFDDILGVCLTLAGRQRSYTDFQVIDTLARIDLYSGGLVDTVRLDFVFSSVPTKP